MALVNGIFLMQIINNQWVSKNGKEPLSYLSPILWLPTSGTVVIFFMDLVHWQQYGQWGTVANKEEINVANKEETNLWLITDMTIGGNEGWKGCISMVACPSYNFLIKSPCVSKIETLATVEIAKWWPCLCYDDHV